MKNLVLLVVVMAVALSAQSQILNIEKFRIDKDTFNVWAGNIGLGFSTKKQQTSVTTLNANSNLVYLSKRHSYLTINYIKFIGVENSDVISEGYTHWRGVFFRKQFVSFEPFVQFQYDLGRGLQQRELYGTTVRLHLLQTPKVLIAFNSGGMYEHEVWKGPVIRYPVENRTDLAETTFIKSTNSLSIRGDITHNLNLLLVTYYQARFDHFFSPRVISEVQITLKVSQYFSITNQFVSTYDAAPILDNNNFIYSNSTNLVVKF